MKLRTIVVTRSGACHVKTLHTILRCNIKSMQTDGVQHEIAFVNDDPYEKSDCIEKSMKTHDRVFFIDFGIHVDDNSLAVVFEPNENMHVIVFPAVMDGIDWTMFKDKVKSGSAEPTRQMGLHFDTDVSSCISENYYNVKSTRAKTWLMMCKPTIKHMKCRRTGDVKIHPKSVTMFEKFKENGVKIAAYTAANIVITYTHECVGNILNSAGIKSS